MGKYILATHSGTFHADESFATAVIKLFLFKIEDESTIVDIIRTRDFEKLKKADFVVDVVGVYDENRFLFDHHQRGFEERRTNGSPYASFGLVWRCFGVRLCLEILKEFLGKNSELFKVITLDLEKDAERVALMVDKSLVEPIDISDSGPKISDIEEDDESEISFLLNSKPEYSLSKAFANLNPCWIEKDESLDTVFIEKAHTLACLILKAEIKKAISIIWAEKIVWLAMDKYVGQPWFVLETGVPWPGAFFKKEPNSNFYFVVFENNEQQWVVQTIYKSANSREYRKLFPKVWGGRRGEELQIITGVPEAVFCHSGLHLVVATTLSGALKLAEIAYDY